MTAKILTALVAAVAVTVVGLYASFGGNPFQSNGCSSCEKTEASLPISEGSCCALKAAQATEGATGCPLSHGESTCATEAEACGHQDAVFALIGTTPIACATGTHAKAAK